MTGQAKGLSLLVIMLQLLSDRLCHCALYSLDSFEFFTVCTKLAEMAILYSKDLTTAKESYLQWGSTCCYRLLLVPNQMSF